MRILAVGLFVCTAAALFGQESFYRVYQYETPLHGWAEPTLWTTYIPRSNNAYSHYGRELPREGLIAHSAEFEYGITDHASLSAYLDFEDPHGRTPQFTRGRIETRYHIAQPYEHFFDMALYAEYYIPNPAFSRNQEVETRLILQKDLNDFRVVMNPILTETTTGPGGGSNPELAFAGGVYYRRRLPVQFGIETYNNFGLIGGPSGFTGQRHVIMPVVEFRPARGWVWQLGVGAGLTGPSDKVVLKSILYYEFNAIRPTQLFHH